MDCDTYLEVIGQQGAAFARALEAGPGAAVASCPGWRVADLAVHLGVTHRWSAAMVRRGASERLGDAKGAFGVDPEDPGLVAWFQEGLRQLQATLAAADPARPVWSWIPGSTATFWCRRQAHETTVHRWDAQAAVARPEPIAAPLATDGIDEVLRVFAAGRSRARSERSGTGEGYRFSCTDSEGAWSVRFEGPGIEVGPADSPADLAVRAPASDLLLFLWGRRGPQVLECQGQADLVDRWFALVPPA